MLFGASGAFAIGEFSVGLNAGVTYAPNNIESVINRYNTAMENYADANAGTEVTQINVPYSPVFGFNVRYQFNYFLFRLGCHYSDPILPIKGSITPAGGVENKIEVRTYQNSFPATVGLIIPLKKRTYFYIGAGGTLHQSYIRIKQSDPVQVGFNMQADLGVSKNTRDRYYKTFVGYHLILGAEVPVSDKYTITAEWVHQEGRSFPVKNEGRDENGNSISTPRRGIEVKGDILLFGVNYYIPI
jgi:opacity protein-like surface antigen